MKNEQQRSRRDRKSGIWCLKIRVLIKLSRKLWPIPVRKILKTVGWLLWQTSWHLPQLTLWKTFCAMDPCPHYNGALFVLKLHLNLVCQHMLQIFFCSQKMTQWCLDVDERKIYHGVWVVPNGTSTFSELENQRYEIF